MPPSLILETNLTNLASPKESAMMSIQDWQCRILETASKYFSAPSQESMQDRTAIWGTGIPFPTQDHMDILPNSCLLLDLLLCDKEKHKAYPVSFGVWMTIGEVRIGAKIHSRLLSDQNLHHEISCGYNGSRCSRETSIQKMEFFDWIFTDRFACFSYMNDALRDHLCASVIARRIGEVLTHLYLNAITRLTQYRDYDLVFIPRTLRIDNPDKSKRLVLVEGDGKSFDLLIRKVIGDLIVPSSLDTYRWVITRQPEGAMQLRRDNFTATELQVFRASD